MAAMIRLFIIAAIAIAVSAEIGRGMSTITFEVGGLSPSKVPEQE